MPQNEKSEIGLMIPREILLSDLLSIMEKLVFFGICSLGDEKYESFASNGTIGELLGIRPRRVSEIVASLKQKGFLLVTIKNNNARQIRVAGKYARKMRVAEMKKPPHLA